MSGVWVFKNGVVRAEAALNKKTVEVELVHVPTGEVVSSYTSLTEILLELGWRAFDDGNAELLQFYKASELISLPKDFDRFRAVHMAIVSTKNPGVFKLVKKSDEQKESDEQNETAAQNDELRVG